MKSVLDLNKIFFFLCSLVKNHEHRPKYPELMEQPFMKEYLNRDVDVAGWFKEIQLKIR